MIVIIFEKKMPLPSSAAGGGRRRRWLTHIDVRRAKKSIGISVFVLLLSGSPARPGLIELASGSPSLALPLWSHMVTRCASSHNGALNATVLLPLFLLFLFSSSLFFFIFFSFFPPSLTPFTIPFTRRSTGLINCAFVFRPEGPLSAESVVLPAVREVTGPPERDSLCLAVDRNGRRGPEWAGRGRGGDDHRGGGRSRGRWGFRDFHNMEFCFVFGARLCTQSVSIGPWQWKHD